MKITNNDGNIRNLLSAGQSGQSSSVRENVKSINDLVPGEKFKAGIVNITPKGITLRLEGGVVIDAKLLVSPDAHIGDNAIFMVTENFKGQILLEMVGRKETSGIPLVSQGVARDSLLAADMPLTEQNFELVQSLVENGMPIDSKTLQAAAFFMYSDPELSFEQIKFLLNENFPVEEKTLKVLNAVLDKSMSINKNINELVSRILDIHDENVKSEFLKILSDSEIEFSVKEPYNQINERESTQVLNIEKNNRNVNPIVENNSGDVESVEKLQSAIKAVKDKFYVDLDNNELKNVEKIYKELAKTTEELLTHIRQKGDFPEIEKSLVDIKDNLEFMNRIQNFKEYLQIPFQTGQIEQECEFHVFKRKKKKFSENDSISALLSMDYPFLKHIEIFVVKNQNKVTLEFKAENTKILNAIGSSMYKLSNAISSKGYKLANVNYKKLEESFDVTSTPEIPNGLDESAIRKYSVDVRV